MERWRCSWASATWRGPIKRFMLLPIRERRQPGRHRDHVSSYAPVANSTLKKHDGKSGEGYRNGDCRGLKRAAGANVVALTQ